MRMRSAPDGTVGGTMPLTMNPLRLEHSISDIQYIPRCGSGTYWQYAASDLGSADNTENIGDCGHSRDTRSSSPGRALSSSCTASM